MLLLQPTARPWAAKYSSDQTQATASCLFSHIHVCPCLRGLQPHPWIPWNPLLALPAITSTVLLVIKECFFSSGLQLKAWEPTSQTKKEPCCLSDIPLPAICSSGTQTLLSAPSTGLTGLALEAAFFVKGPGQSTLPSQGLTPCPTIPSLLSASSWGELTPHRRSMNSLEQQKSRA